MVFNGLTKCHSVETNGCIKVVNIYIKIIVSTLTVAVATLSANILKCCFIGLTRFHSVDTNGCSSNA